MTKTRTLDHRKIYEGRLRAGMSQEDVAHGLRRHGFRYAARSVSFWERDINRPRADVIPALADVLGVALDDLYSSDDDEEADQPMDAMDMELLRALKKWRTANQAVA